MRRAGATFAIALAACGGHLRAPTPAADACFERYAPYGPADVLSCANLAVGTLGPAMAGPGRVRMVFEWAVPGVPAGTPDAGFYVVDLTPAGQQLVATGNCSGGSPDAMTWDGNGAFHVICEDGATRLDDLVLGSGGFTQARPPLQLDDDAFPTYRLTVAFPADGTPYAIYATHGYRPDPWGPTRVRRWADDAPAYLPVVAEHDPDGPTTPDPSLVIVQDGAVRLIAGQESSGSGDDQRAWRYRLVELGPTGAIDRGALALTPAPDDYACGATAATFATSSGLDAIVPASIAIGPVAEDASARIHLDGARAVPAASADEPPESACRNVHATWATSCEPGGCVSASVDWSDFTVRVTRETWPIATR